MMLVSGVITNTTGRLSSLASKRVSNTRAWKIKVFPNPVGKIATRSFFLKWSCSKAWHWSFIRSIPRCSRMPISYHFYGWVTVIWSRPMRILRPWEIGCFEESTWSLAGPSYPLPKPRSARPPTPSPSLAPLGSPPPSPLPLEPLRRLCFSKANNIEV